MSEVRAEAENNFHEEKRLKKAANPRVWLGDFGNSSQKPRQPGQSGSHFADESGLHSSRPVCTLPDRISDSFNMPIPLRVRQKTDAPEPPPTSGPVELVIDAAHLQHVVLNGILKAQVSIDIMTADFKAMLVPDSAHSRCAVSIVEIFRRLARRGVEIRLLHAGTPSSAALRELKNALPENLVIRRCPRLHAKAVIIDSRSMYLGSANLTGAGLGAKGEGKRNFEMGVWARSFPMIETVLEQFNALWEGHRCESCRRREICPVPLEEPRLS